MDENMTEFIGALESLMIPVEEGTLSIFFTDPENYVHHYVYEGTGEPGQDLGALHLDGEITIQVKNAIGELTQVNSYNMALAIVSRYISIIDSLLSKSSREIKETLTVTLNDMKDLQLKTREKRDTYFNKREAINGKWKSVLCSLSSEK